MAVCNGIESHKLLSSHRLVFEAQIISDEVNSIHGKMVDHVLCVCGGGGYRVSKSKIIRCLKSHMMSPVNST